jgi:transcriptional regulator with XRE-family HTH domain
MTLRDTVEVNPSAMYAARVTRKLTLDDAAKALGMSRTTLHAVESGRRPAAENELERIAKLYRVKPAALAAARAGKE